MWPCYLNTEDARVYVPMTTIVHARLWRETIIVCAAARIVLAAAGIVCAAAGINLRP